MCFEICPVLQLQKEKKPQKIASFGKDVEKLEPLHMESKTVQPLGESLVVPQIVKHRITIWFKNSTSRIELNKLKIEIQTNISSQQHYPQEWKGRKNPNITHR
jgi:hypothetical protein